MLGAIAGDFVGSIHEYTAIKRKDFALVDPRCFVTDDSLLTVAVAEWVLDGTPLVPRFHDLVAAYPGAGWGLRFGSWARARRTDPYHSFGNGAAMRVSPVGWAFAGLDDTLRAAAESAAVTHDHPEGIKGAQAAAAAVYLARTTRDKALIRREIAHRFGYELDRTVDVIRPTYKFDETCQRTVPEAVIAFLDGSDFEDTLRNAVSLGGDADTLACIAGGIAHAYYGGVPEALATPPRWRRSPAPCGGSGTASALASLYPPDPAAWATQTYLTKRRLRTPKPLRLHPCSLSRSLGTLDAAKGSCWIAL